jgi:hypothetical protein
MYQLYVDGRGIACQLSLNAAIVVVEHVRVKETEVVSIRAFPYVSYAEAVRRMEERSEVEELMVVGVETLDNISSQQRDPDMLHVKVVLLHWLSTTQRKQSLFRDVM